MKASEIVYEILGGIRKANNVLSKNHLLTADDMLSLSGIYQHIIEYDRYPDYLVSQLKLENNNAQALEQLSRLVNTECSTYIEMYDLREEEWVRQCGFSNLMNIIGDKVNQEYGLKIKIAEDEIRKASLIFDKYNDITRLYNSLDCRNDKEKDKQILEKYRVELENLIRRTVKFETINEEHDAAYSFYKEKKKELDVLSDKVFNYKADLLKQLRGNPILDIYDFCEGLRDAFAKDKGIQNVEQKRRPGRPTKKDKYEADEIKDLASCFCNSEYYSRFLKMMDRLDSISGIQSKIIFQMLANAGWLKDSFCSAEDFAGFMVESFGRGKMSISKGHSTYKGNYDDEYKEKIKSLLKF